MIADPLLLNAAICVVPLCRWLEHANDGESVLLLLNMVSDCAERRFGIGARDMPLPWEQHLVDMASDGLVDRLVLRVLGSRQKDVDE